MMDKERLTVTLTDRQLRELVSLAGYPPTALDDEAAEELARLNLVEEVPNPGYASTKRYRFTNAGRAMLPPGQAGRLAETEGMELAKNRMFAGLKRQGVI